MGKRRSPYLTKTKAAKNRENSNTSAVTDYFSQDIFYTTESNDTQPRYDYTNKYKNYKEYFTSDTYDSRLFDTYSPKRKGSGESYTYDDYTTSGVSYKKQKKRPNDLIYSVSTTDYIYESPEKYDKISSFRDHNHSYPRSREKKLSRLAESSDQPNYRNRLHDSEQNMDRERRYRSPRSRYYKDLIHEEPEKEFEYEQYFEKTTSKVANSPKQRRQGKYDDERYEKQNKLQSRIPKKHNDYQVYAYQDPNHQGIFKSKNHPGDLSFSSEVEIKTHEYPVLAFRDTKSGKHESDMVYLPIIVLDKKSGKSRPEKSINEPIYQANNEPIYQANKDNFQIFAANLQEQQNIFQNLGNFTKAVASKERTSREKEDTQQQGFGVEAKSGMKYADSLLGTIIDEAVDSDFRNEDFVNEIETDQKMPLTTGLSPFTYQVDVDISPSEPAVSSKDQGKKPSNVKNSSMNDSLYDGYPVTKDYIKVSVSEQKRQNSLNPLPKKEENKKSSVKGQTISEENKLNTIKEENRNPSTIKLIDDQTISMSIAKSKASPATKSIMRNPSQEQPPDEFSSHRKSVPVSTKQNSRASHIRPDQKAETKGISTVSKRSVLNDLKRQSTKPESPQRQSAVKSSKVAGLVSPDITPGTESRHRLHSSDRKSMALGQQDGKSVGRQSKVLTTPLTPLTASPALSHNKSAVESEDRKNTVAQMVVTQTPSSQNMRASHAQNRKSAGTPRLSAAAAIRDDSRKSMKASATGQSQKAIPKSIGKRSMVPNLAHQKTHTLVENTGQLSQRIDVEDDSEEALRQFTKNVFDVDLGSQGKTPSHKSEQKKPSVSQDKLVDSNVHPSHVTESNHQSKKSAVGQGSRQQSVEPTHERIGDSTAGFHQTPMVENKKKASKLFKTLSMIQMIGKTKKNSTVQENPYIPTVNPTDLNKSEGKANPATLTQGIDDSHFVRSIEPTVAQYKKEQNKTNTLTKSQSKLDTKAPKEKKSLSRLFSRSKSKSGDNNKKMKKSKSKSLLGILKRSKSSEMSIVRPAQVEELPAEDKQAAECECIAHYIQNTRTCAYFFLGTTLHEQIMNIIKIFLSGN